MAGPAAIIRLIHRLRRQARDLQAEIERVPRAVRVQHDRVALREEALREAQEGLKRLKVANHEKEVSLRTRANLVSKHEKQLNEAASKKEYDALKAEIDAERAAWRKLEDEILEGMMEVEERTARLPDAEKAVAQAREEAARFERESAGRAAALNEELGRVNAELAAVETTLPAEVRPQYDRLVAARGEDALAALAGRTCTACYTEITHQNYNELLQERFVVCKNCDRMLYLAE